MKLKGQTRNAVCRKLECGNGSIAGMKLLLPVEKTCLVEVVVRGIEFERKAYGGVNVRVEPAHGVGNLYVDATRLVDDTNEARDLYFRRSEAAEFVRKHRPNNSNDRHWRSCVVGLRAKLDADQVERFDAAAGKLTQGKALTKANAYELEKLLPVLAAIRYDLDDAAEAVDDD